MTIHPVIFLVPSLVLVSLLLRRKNPKRRARFILPAVFSANLAALGLSLALIPGAMKTTAIVRIGEGLLTAISAAATVFFWLFFRGVDFFVANPGGGAAAVGIPAAGLAVIAIFPPSRGSQRRQNLRRGAVIVLSALAVFAVFYLLYWRITPEQPRPAGFFRQLPAIMEAAVGIGVGIIQFTVAGAASVRRIIIAGTIVLAIALFFRKNRPFGTVLMVGATGLALLAQTYLISGDTPEAIYLYLAAGMVLAVSRLFGRPPKTSEPSRSPRQAVLIALVLVISIVFGLYRLEAFPVRYHPDEAMGGWRILEAAARNWNTASSLKEAVSRSRVDPNAAFAWDYWDPDARPNPRTPVSTHLAYLCLKIFPVNFVTLRASTVLVGALSALFLYLTLRTMFGAAPAAMGAFLLATSTWQVTLNRFHFPHSATNLYVLICFYLFWKAQDKGAIRFYLLLGTALAFSNTFYPTFKMVYLLLPAFVLYRAAAERGYLKKQLPGLLVAAAAFLLILNAREIDPVGQLFLYRGVGADTVVHHQDYMSGPETFREAGGKSILAVRRLLKLIFDPAPFELRRQPYIERGIYFNPLLVPFSVLGFFWSLSNLKRRNYSFLVLWLVFALLPNIITGEGVAARRTTLLIAPMMAAAALFLHVAWTATAHRLLRGRAGRGAAAFLATAGFAFLILTSSAAEFFHTYQHAAEHIICEFKEFKNVDRFLEQALENDYMIYFLNRDSRHYLPHHEAHWYLLVRLFSSREGRFVQRPYQADSRQSVDRESLRAADDGAGFVVIGPAEERVFISNLFESHPGAEMSTYRRKGRQPFEINALVVPGRKQQ